MPKRMLPWKQHLAPPTPWPDIVMGASQDEGQNPRVQKVVVLINELQSNTCVPLLSCIIIIAQHTQLLHQLNQRVSVVFVYSHDMTIKKKLLISCVNYTRCIMFARSRVAYRRRNAALSVAWPYMAGRTMDQMHIHHTTQSRSQSPLGNETTHRHVKTERWC